MSTSSHDALSASRVVPQSPSAVLGPHQREAPSAILVEDLGLETLRFPFGPDYESEGDGVFRLDHYLTT